MEYPGARFTHPLRIIMLSLFVAAFFILSPTIILYSAGYRYDFKNGLLRETGSLSVDILPANTSVTIDNVLLNDTMPLRLNNLTPHKYTIKLSAPGYYDLEQEIEIQKNQTTYFKEISLVQKNKPELFQKGNFFEPSVSADGSYVAYYEKVADGLHIYIADTTNGIATLVLRLPTSTPIRFTWNKKSNYVIVSNHSAPYTLLYTIDAVRPTNIINILAKSTTAAQKFIWQNSTNPEIYFDATSTIYSYFPITQTIRPIAQTNFVDWYSDTSNVWSLSYSTTTNEFAVRGDTFGFTNTLASFKNTFANSPTTRWHLLAVQGSSALLRNEADKQFYIIRANKSYHVTGDTFFLSPYNNWWILTSPWEIWTYSDGGEPSLLTRTDTALINVLPLDKYNTLGLITTKNIAALYPYYFIKKTILDKPINEATVTPTKRTVYFTTTDGLWRLAY